MIFDLYRGRAGQFVKMIILYGTFFSSFEDGWGSWPIIL